MKIKLLVYMGCGLLLLTAATAGTADRQGPANAFEKLPASQKFAGGKAHLDTDKDGMPNAFEKKHGLNPFGNDAAEDPDRDRVSNLVEYYFGTDPQAPGSTPSKGVHYVYDELGRIKQIIRIK